SISSGLNGSSNLFKSIIHLRMDTAQVNNADLILQSLPHLKIREHLHDLPSGDTLTPAAC
ncbi:hypothetical protein, partial [Escherichia coli]|uniref:hypothetical protein n=1 Tax=Escherichia coli TaxID=562 RepID=UPI001F141E22